MVCDGDCACAMVIVIVSVSKLFYCFLFCWVVCFVCCLVCCLVAIPVSFSIHLPGVAVSLCRGFIRPNQAHGSLGGLEGLAGARARAEFGVLEDELPSLLSSPSRHCFAHCKALG